MADVNPDLNLGGAAGAKKGGKTGGKKSAGNNAGNNAGKKGGGKKLITTLLLLAVLVAGWIVGKPYLGGAEETVAAENKAQAPTVEAKTPDSKAPTVYLAIDPPLIVNFNHNNTLRYLQVSASVMARSEAVIEQVKHHMPAIRHAFIMMLSGADYAQLGTREGKEAIRQQMLGQVRDIIAQDGGDDSVEDLFITGFVMQ